MTERWHTLIASTGTAPDEPVTAGIYVEAEQFPPRRTARLHITKDDRADNVIHYLLDDGTWWAVMRGTVFPEEMRHRMGIEVPVAIVDAIRSVRGPEVLAKDQRIRELEADVDRWRKIAEAALATVDAVRYAATNQGATSAAVA